MNDFKRRFPTIEAWRNATPEEKRQVHRDMIADLQNDGVWLGAYDDQLIILDAKGALTDRQRDLLQGLKWFLLPELRTASGNGHS